MRYSRKWMDYFFDLVDRTAQQSKDPSTKVGAVLVHDKRVMATGYNGFAHNIADTLDRYNDRTMKLALVVHAEANCLLQCAKYGVSTDGLSLFVSLAPCIECAKMAIQAGIKCIYFKKQNLDVKRAASELEWRDKIQLSLDMLKEAGVEIYEYDTNNGTMVNMQYLNSTIVLDEACDYVVPDK